MPAPTISAASSILGFRRKEPWQFQPGATGAPTSWAISSVPAQITINGSTGLISCTGIPTAGPIVFTVTATNGDGSGSREFVAGISSEIFAEADESAEAASEWTFDVVTRMLKADVAAAGAATAIPESILAHWKQDDKFLLRIRITKNGAQIDPDPSAVKLVTKEIDAEEAVTIADVFFRSVAEGSGAYFDLLVDLSDEKLKDVLSDKETDAAQTKWDALVQLQVEYPLEFDETPETMRVTSRTGIVEIARDFVD